MAKQQPKVTIKKVVTKTAPVQKAKPVPVTRVKQVADSLSKTGKPKDMQRAKQLNTNVSNAVAKANANKPTKDSTAYFANKSISERMGGYRQANNAAVAAGRNPKTDARVQASEGYIQKADDSRLRQANKGKAGYDKNGYPKK